MLIYRRDYLGLASKELLWCVCVCVCARVVLKREWNSLNLLQSSHTIWTSLLHESKDFFLFCFLVKIKLNGFFIFFNRIIDVKTAKNSKDIWSSVPRVFNCIKSRLTIFIHSHFGSFKKKKCCCRNKLESLCEKNCYCCDTVSCCTTWRIRPLWGSVDNTRQRWTVVAFFFFFNTRSGLSVDGNNQKVSRGPNELSLPSVISSHRQNLGSVCLPALMWRLAPQLQGPLC